MHLISFHELYMRLYMYIYVYNIYFFLPHYIYLAPQYHKASFSNQIYEFRDLFREFNARTLNGIIDRSCSFLGKKLSTVNLFL